MSDPRTPRQIEPRQIEPRHGHAVPFVIGNLGARAIIDVAKGRPPAPDPLFADLPRLAALGIDAVEDYVGWNVIEKKEGAPDFSLHRRHRDEALRLGLSYVVYPWVHALPPWLADSARLDRARCLEHGQTTIHPSIFAPSTLSLYDRFYALLASGLGADLESVTLALPCDYGEVGYPTGMGAWVLDAENDATHRHPGFWCGDEFAVRDFRARMFARFGSLDAVNAILGASFRRDDDVRPLAPPDLDAASDRFRFELAEWYRDALLGFVRAIVKVARTHFPRARLAIKCGHASELLSTGIDYARLVPLCAELGLTLWSTHGTLSTVFHRRIRTLCTIHGVPYFTEAPTERSREQILARFADDEHDGAEGFFEFHDTFLEYERDFLEQRPRLKGAPRKRDVAVLFHSTGQILHPRLEYPSRLFALGEHLRDLVEFDVLDEETIAHTAALDRYAVVLVVDPGPIRADALAALERFAARGGRVVLPAAPALHPIAGVSTVFSADPSHHERFTREELSFESEDVTVAIRFGEVDDEILLFGDWNGRELAAPYFATPRHPHARWTAGRAGFRLPRPVGRDAVLSVQLHVDPRALSTPVLLSCDGAPVLRIDEPGSVTLRFDVAAATPGHRVFEFEFACTPFRPADHGSADRRSLGLLIHYAGFDGSATSRAKLTPSVSAEALALRTRRVGAGGIVFAPPHDPLAWIGCVREIVCCSTR